MTTYKLTDAAGRELIAGQTVTTFRGEQGKLISWTEPRDRSTGRVTVAMYPDGWHREYYPSVIGASFIEATDGDSRPAWESEALADEQTRGGY